MVSFYYCVHWLFSVSIQQIMLRINELDNQMLTLLITPHQMQLPLSYEDSFNNIVCRRGVIHPVIFSHSNVVYITRNNAESTVSDSPIGFCLRACRSRLQRGLLHCLRRRRRKRRFWTTRLPTMNSIRPPRSPPPWPRPMRAPRRPTRRSRQTLRSVTFSWRSWLYERIFYYLIKYSIDWKDWLKD